MDRHDVSLLVLYGAGRAPDVQYLANWPGTREAYLVVPRQGESTLLVQFNNHVPNAVRTSAVRDVRWAGNGSDAVVEAIRATGAHRVGIVGQVPWSVARRISEPVSGIQLVDLTSELRAIRSIASAEELELLREAARITDLAMEALEREARPGLRETELAGIVESAIARGGGTPGIHFMAATPMLAPEIGVPSQIQSARVIARGDVLITEITAHHWGYGGQIHRAYSIGEDPTDEYRRIHDAAVETYERICAVLRDGATVADVLDAADVARERGYTTYDDLLHGTDQLPPVLQTRDAARGPQPEDFVFREDMVVVVQPNLVRDASGRMGLQVGETVRVTRRGTERLHPYPMRFVRCG
jgi:Xaa-Pro dipeptidase/ectoine hydrolase